MSPFKDCYILVNHSSKYNDTVVELWSFTWYISARPSYISYISSRSINIKTHLTYPQLDSSVNLINFNLQGTSCWSREFRVPFHLVDGNTRQSNTSKSSSMMCCDDKEKVWFERWLKKRFPLPPRYDNTKTKFETLWKWILYKTSIHCIQAFQCSKDDDICHLTRPLPSPLLRLPPGKSKSRWESIEQVDQIFQFPF